jgi:predicted MFS family arabinose efflux permease
MMKRIIGALVLGLLAGALLGGIVFDDGPGIEPLALAVAAAGALAGAAAGYLTRRTRLPLRNSGSTMPGSAPPARTAP